jgi:hypothetical protein
MTKVNEVKVNEVLDILDNVEERGDRLTCFGDYGSFCQRPPIQRIRVISIKGTIHKLWTCAHCLAACKNYIQDMEILESV